MCLWCNARCRRNVSGGNVTRKCVAIVIGAENFLAPFRAAVAGLVVPLIWLMSSSAGVAACAPAAGPGAPPSGTTVTCSGTTTNQNAPIGYGDASQNGLTINVTSGASVIGTSGGFALDGQITANTINNNGTIRDDGSNPVSFSAISTVASAAINLNNNASGVISASSTNANAIVIGVNT